MSVDLSFINSKAPPGAKSDKIFIIIPIGRKPGGLRPLRDHRFTVL